MEIHNRYDLFCGDVSRSAQNSISGDFAGKFSSAENLLEYIYLFTADGITAKQKAEYAGGSVKNRHFLKLHAHIREGVLDGKSIVAVGVGGESGHISRAELSPLIKDGKITVNATLFMQTQTSGRVLSDKFYLMLLGDKSGIDCAFLSEKDRQTKNYNYAKQQKVSPGITYGGGIDMTFTMPASNRHLLISKDGEPAFIAEDAGGGKTACRELAKNFCIDTGKQIHLNESAFSANTVPPYAVIPYGMCVDRARDFNTEVALGEGNFKANADGTCFVIRSGNRFLPYMLAEDGLSCPSAFGADISAEGVVDYDVYGGGLAVLYTDGRLKFFSFLSGEITLAGQTFAGGKTLEVSDDLSLVNIKGDAEGALYYPESNVKTAYALSAQRYSICKTGGTVMRLFGGNAAAYSIVGGALSAMHMSSNMFFGTDEQKIRSFGVFLAKIGEKSVLFYSIYNGSTALFSDDNIVKIILSPGGNYILARYKNGAVKLYRFNKSSMSVSSLELLEPFAPGDYYFLGNSRLVRVSPGSSSVYSIIGDKSEILFKKTGYGSGEYPVYEYAGDDSPCVVRFKTEVV